MRRIAVLRAYEALPARTTKAAQEMAEELGLSIRSFYNLWRSWRNLRDPAELKGARNTRSRTDTGEDREYVLGLLASLSTDGSHESKVLEIERLAKAQGVRIRSRTALRRLVRDVREQDADPAPVEAPANVIALDMVAVEIAVNHDGITMLPLAAVITHPSSGTVVSVMLSVQMADPRLAAAALARWLSSLVADGSGTDVDTLLVPTTNGEWGMLIDTLSRNGIGCTRPIAPRMASGAIISATFGRSILGIEVRPRMGNRAPEARRPRARSDRLGGPITLAEAQAAMDERIARTMLPTLRVRQASPLASDLRRLVDYQPGATVKPPKA